MPIERDDGAERQARIEWMINEFREAQARRISRKNDKIVGSKPDANAPVSGSGNSH